MGLPAAFGISYHHVAYRLYVRARTADGRSLDGIYFVRSDADSRSVMSEALASDPLDSHFEEQRAREAERIVSRAFRRTLEVPIEQRARGTFNLGGLVDLAGSWSGPRSGSPLADAAGPGPREAVELKLDAHPKLVLRATFLGFRGRVEVPILDDPLRVVFERPLGARGSATLTGGTSRDGRDWATLNFSLRF